MNIDDLKKPLTFDEIEWKVQSTKWNKEKNRVDYTVIVPYINKKIIVERLNKIVGIGNWKNELKEWHNNNEMNLNLETLKFIYDSDEKKIKKFIENIYTKKQICGLSIKIENEWITKWDGADNTDIESTKGGISSSFKRAANLWGLGLELNDFPVIKIEGKANYISFEHIKFFKGIYNTPIEKRSYSYTYSKNNKEMFSMGETKKKSEKEEIIDSINSMATKEEVNKALNHYSVNILDDLSMADLQYIHDQITTLIVKISKGMLSELLEAANTVGQDIHKVIKKRFKKDSPEDLIVREGKELMKDFKSFM